MNACVCMREGMCSMKWAERGRSWAQRVANNPVQERYGTLRRVRGSTTVERLCTLYSRLAMATFLRTFSRDGIFGPACWEWGVRALPLSLYQPPPLELPRPPPSPVKLARFSYLYSDRLPLSPSSVWYLLLCCSCYSWFLYVKGHSVQENQWKIAQRCGTVTIFYGSASGSGSDLWKVMVPVPTFEKLWFRFRFQFLLMKIYGSGSGSCSGSGSSSICRA